MKGIIYKDYMHVLLPKNMISLFFNFIVAASIVLILDNFYGFALTTMTFALSGLSLLQLSMEQDELSNFDKFQITLPLTKKQIVLSKYIGGLIMQSVYFVITLLVALGYYWFGKGTLVMVLQVWVLGIIVGLIFFAISYVGFYLLGNKRGSIMYLITLTIVIIGYLLAFFNFDVASILTLNHNLLLIIGLVIAVLFLIASFYISLKIYTHRYS